MRLRRKWHKGRCIRCGRRVLRVWPKVMSEEDAARYFCPSGQGHLTCGGDRTLDAILRARYPRA